MVNLMDHEIPGKLEHSIFMANEKLGGKMKLVFKTMKN